MTTNPFLKEESINYPFFSNDFKETLDRFNYIKEIKGIGLFIGQAGVGKTYALRYFINNLNKDLYKVIYIKATYNMSVFDFFKVLSDELDIDIGACYKSDNYKNIQKEIKRLTNKERINLVVAIDDANLLSREILFNLKILYDFEMDEKDYVSIILMGYPELKIEIKKMVHETLRQRIIVNYEFKGLSRKEVKEYVKSRLKIANTNQEIFKEEALNALYSCSKSSPRRLNTLIINSLMLGKQNNMPLINEEIVMNAKEEMDLK